MTVDLSKLQFVAPLYPVDKIAVYSSSTSASNNDIAGAGLAYSILGSSTTSTTLTTVQTIKNPYGRKCLTNAVFSLNGTNWYDQNTALEYYNSTERSPGLRMSMFCGCSDSTIYFVFNSQYTSTQTVYVQFAVDSIS